MRTERVPTGCLRGPEVCGDYAALEDFLDREFDGTPGIAREFPLLIGARNPGRSWILTDEGSILSHAAWRPLELRAGARRIKAAGIGLVTTAERARRRGLAGRVISSCLAAACEQGCELAVLFATPSALYTRAGFVPAGRERVVRLDPEPGRLGAGIRRGGADDAARLLPLLERHLLRVSRTAAEFAALLEIPNTCLYIAEYGDRPAAYCVVGKGRDLPGVVHEWAGVPEAVESLLHAVASLRSESLAVIGPEAVAPPVSGKSGVGALAMFRVLRPESLGGADAVDLLGDAETPARLPLYVWGLDSI